MREKQKTALIFKVIVSYDNKGYSLWIADREDPPGWRDAGLLRGSATECLACISENGFRERQHRSAPESSPASRQNQFAQAACA